MFVYVYPAWKQTPSDQRKLYIDSTLDIKLTSIRGDRTWHSREVIEYQKHFLSARLFINEKCDIHTFRIYRCNFPSVLLDNDENQHFRGVRAYFHVLQSLCIPRYYIETCH